MVAARTKDHYAELAKERQKRKPKGSVVANLPQQKNDKSRDQAGGVSDGIDRPGYQEPTTT